VHGLAVDDPEDGVVLAPGGCREMQRHHRREGPIEQPRRQAVVLTEREPIPLGRARRLLMRVLAEVAQKVTFDVRVVALEARQARDVLVGRAREAAVYERRARVPRMQAPVRIADDLVEDLPAVDSSSKTTGPSGPPRFQRVAKSSRSRSSAATHSASSAMAAPERGRRGWLCEPTDAWVEARMRPRSRLPSDLATRASGAPWFPLPRMCIRPWGGLPVRCPPSDRSQGGASDRR
jgi:hypothetical protein